MRKSEIRNQKSEIKKDSGQPFFNSEAWIYHQLSFVISHHLAVYKQQPYVILWWSLAALAWPPPHPPITDHFLLRLYNFCIPLKQNVYIVSSSHPLLYSNQKTTFSHFTSTTQLPTNLCVLLHPTQSIIFFILYHFMYKNCRVTPIKHILIQKNLYRDEAEKIQKMRYLWYNLYVLLLEPKQFSCLQDSVGPRPLGKIAFSSLTIDEHDQSTSPSLWPWPIVTDHSESWCDMMWLFLCFRDQWKRVSRKGKFFFHLNKHLFAAAHSFWFHVNRW